jgi:hypothetical protein
VSTLRVSIAAVVVCAFLSGPGHGEESAEQAPPHEFGNIIDMGNQVGNILDKMPMPGEQQPPPESAAAEQSDERSGATWIIMIIANAIGAGMLVYARKQMNPSILLSGVALLVVPYVIVDAIALLLVCSLICALPWGLKWAGIGK